MVSPRRHTVEGARTRKTWGRKHALDTTPPKSLRNAAPWSAAPTRITAGTDQDTDLLSIMRALRGLGDTDTDRLMPHLSITTRSLFPCTACVVPAPAWTPLLWPMAPALPPVQSTPGTFSVLGPRLIKVLVSHPQLVMSCDKNSNSGGNTRIAETPPSLARTQRTFHAPIFPGCGARDDMVIPEAGKD